MVKTYADLFLDARRALLKQEGQFAANVARELVCAASGKSAEQIISDRELYASEEVCELTESFVQRRLRVQFIGEVCLICHHSVHKARQFFSIPHEPEVAAVMAQPVRQLRFCGSLRRGEARRLHSRHGLCVIYASKFDFHGYPFFFRGFGSGVTRRRISITCRTSSRSSRSRTEWTLAPS